MTRRPSTDEALARARCATCGGGLGFDEWSRGEESCSRCRKSSRIGGPAATYVRGPAAAPPVQTSTPRQPAYASTEAEQYERLLDDLPDELIDEIVAALEAESGDAQARPPNSATGALTGVLEEIGFGRSTREFQLAAWGFAIGFGVNVVIAKYAQMQTGASTSQFIGPLLLGGVAAGAACGAIGWGLAKLRER